MSTREGPGWTAQELVDQMNCGMVVHDRAGCLIFANPRFCEWLGYTLEEIKGRPATDLAPPELAEVVRTEMGAVINGDRRAVLCVLQRKDSTTFPVLIAPQALPEAGGACEGSLSVIFPLDAVQAAKHAGYPDPNEARATLSRIASELESLSFSTAFSVSVALPFGHPRLSSLSPREREVLTCLVSGDRVAAIATELDISEHTVRNHLKSIFGKLKVQRQSELIELVRSLTSA